MINIPSSGLPGTKKQNPAYRPALILRVFPNIFVFFFLCAHLCAQKAADPVIQLIKDADFYFERGDYFNALNGYNKVLAIDPKNEKASLNALISRFEESQPVDSVIALSANLQNSKLTEAAFWLGKVNHKLKNFDVAITYFNSYKTIDPKKRRESNDAIEHMIASCESAKLQIARPHKAVIKNMGSEINSPFDDYVPVITSDENTLYFTSRREGSSNGAKDPLGNYYEDIYVSEFKNGKWEKPKNAGPPLNTLLNDACVALSHDGQRMIVFRSAPDLRSGHLMFSEKMADNSWSIPKMFGKEINSQFIETSACFSTDTSEVYFTSNRPGGFGGKDIYRIKRLPNGKWGLPFNLGPNINTAYDEDAPFIHPDGVTMFFSSKGHNTMGDYDVFMSVLNKETNVFTKAENAGYPVNGVNNDVFFVLSADGKHGYYSSLKEDTKGEEDIYVLDTRYGDNDIVVKHGRIMKDNVPGKAKITLLDNGSKQVAGIYTSSGSSGKFILAVNPLVSYKVIVEEAGFNPVVMDIEPVANEKEEKELVIELNKKQN